MRFIFIAHTHRAVHTHKYTLAIYRSTYLFICLTICLQGGRHETFFIPFLKLNNITRLLLLCKGYKENEKRRKLRGDFISFFLTINIVWFLLVVFRVEWPRNLWMKIDNNMRDFVPTHTQNMGLFRISRIIVCRNNTFFKEGNFMEYSKNSTFIWFWPKTIIYKMGKWEQ